jgi:RNA polymerase sigma-70 factor (ECF subfamily)
LATRYVNIHQKLIERCKENDNRAQLKIYKLYYKAMYNASLRIVGVPEDAEDIMQESFLTAFTKLGTYMEEVSFGAWLKRIVVNRSIDYLKKRKVDFEELPYNLEIIEEQAEEPANFTANDVKDAINKLPEGYRIVLTLILLEGYDHYEVSQILGIANSSSRSQYLRAKQKLKEIILREKRKTKLSEAK